LFGTRTIRGGSRRTDLTNGDGGQINNIGTMKEKKGLGNNSKKSDSE